jgi:hypothetical protein
MITIPIQIKTNILEKLNDEVSENREYYSIQSFLRYLIEDDIKEHENKELIEQNYKLINLIVDEELKSEIKKIVKSDDFFITLTSYVNFLIYKYFSEKTEKQRKEILKDLEEKEYIKDIVENLFHEKYD